MMDNGYIFLSYQSSEVSFALKLASDLKNRGVHIWMDRLDGIKGGEDWRRVIENAVNNCAGMISVLSPNYVGSKYCRNEMARADRLDHPIFPILLSTVPAKDWPIEIERNQYINFRDWQDGTAYSKRLDELMAILKGKAADWIGHVPDSEIQYLTNLITALEARRGVLEYIDLAAEADEAERPNPQKKDEGWNAEFSLLLATESQSSPKETAEKQRMPIKSLREVLEQYPRFVLIGEPGAGKTTSLLRMTLDAARMRLDNPRIAPLPLLLFLPQWTTQATALDFITSYYPFKPEELAEAIKRGEILFCLDGLNEMGAKGPSNAQLLKEWIHQESVSQRVIITCRAADYANSFKLNLPTILVEEMNEEQIIQFATNYLRDKAPTFLKQVLPQDVRSKQDLRHLFQLTHNPYMLTALIYVYGNSTQGELPQNSGSLFDSLARTLWQREEKKLTDGWIPFEQMQTMLAHLAFAMIDQETPIDVPQEYVRKYVTEGVINAALNANLLDMRDDKIRFYHQLMQEYFAAVELAQIGVTQRLAAPRGSIYGSRSIGKWDEVIVSLAGIVPDPGPIINQIAVIDCHLAARCLGSGINLTEEARDSIVSQILSVSEPLLSGDGPMYLLKNVYPFLAELGELRIIPTLVDMLAHGNMHRIGYPASLLLAQFGKLAVPELLQALYRPKSETRIRAATILADIGEDRVVPRLIELLSDESYDGFGKPRLMCDVAYFALNKIGTFQAIEAAREWQKKQLELFARSGASSPARIFWTLQGILERHDSGLREHLSKLIDENLSMNLAILVCNSNHLSSETKEPSWIVHSLPQTIMDVLANVKSASSINAFAYIIINGNNESRRRAMDTLFSIGTPKAMEVISRYARG